MCRLGLGCLMVMALMLGCYQPFNMSGFPCRTNQDCLGLFCNDGFCHATDQPREGATLPDGNVVDRGPVVSPSLRCFKGSETLVNVGICRQGFKGDDSEVCYGEIRVVLGDTCGDGIDNDCDGEIDDGCPTSKEICDGLDNDRNGQIDETFEKQGEACASPSTGCSKMVYVCRGGKLTCASETPEKCGNKVDDDCDGVIDEPDECGHPYPYISVYGPRSGPKANVTLTTNGEEAKRFLSKPITLSGDPVLHSAGTINGCENVVLLMTPRTARAAMSYLCDGNDFQVYRHLGGQSNFTGGYYLVTPDNREKNLEQTAWGRLRYQGCDGGRACKLEKLVGVREGEFRLYRQAKGYYRIQTSLCKDSVRPVFVGIFSSKADAFAVATAGVDTRYCDIRIYDQQGHLVDRDFGFWLPNPKRSTWVTISAEGEVLAAHPRSASQPWKVEVNPIGGLYVYKITHPSLTIGSVALVTPRVLAQMTVDIPTNEAPHLHVTSYDPKASLDTPKLVPFTLLVTH